MFSYFMRIRYRLSLSLFLFLAGCIEPYENKSIGSLTLLSVEGFISTDLKQHQVSISRTTSIDKPEFIGEMGAQVSIKNGNDLINLAETSPGIYLTPVMRGIIGQTYQLLITTQRGRQVVSEEVTLKDTPEIQNLYAIFSPTVSENKGGAFQIFLDTEDPTRQSQFYRWEFEETWELRTPFESNYVWLGENNVVFRSDPVSICFGKNSTNNVLLRSTQGLNENKVASMIIQTIPAESRKLQVRYSILVRQFTLSSNAYSYWQTLLKTNQGQGTFSDAQPGTVKGNISSLTDEEAVLGYFDACAVKEKRIFIEPLKFRSSGFLPTAFGENCKFLEYTLVPVNQIGAFLSKAENSNMGILGASGGTLFLLPKECCDCSPLGSIVKPVFWP
jgi:hypothetical protein